MDRDRDSVRRRESHDRDRGRDRDRRRERRDSPPRSRRDDHHHSAPRHRDSHSAGKSSRGGDPARQKRSNRELIRGWDTMSPAERVKAKMEFDLRKAKAFDEDLQGKDEEGHWERFRFDRFASVERTAEDLPSDDERAPAAAAVDFEAAGPAESTAFVGRRAFSATRSNAPPAVSESATALQGSHAAAVSTAGLSAEQRHELAIFGAAPGGAVTDPVAAAGSVPGASTPSKSGTLSEFASDAAQAAAAAAASTAPKAKSGWRARIAARKAKSAGVPDDATSEPG